jgi:hypothetical protein
VIVRCYFQHTCIPKQVLGLKCWGRKQVTHEELTVQGLLSLFPNVPQKCDKSFVSRWEIHLNFDIGVSSD